MSEFERYVRRAEIAYFSMEIALRDEMHTFAGGLGVLAGDMARSAADLDMPMVFVSLASKDGYVKQTFTRDGGQLSAPNPWTPEKWARALSAMVSVEISGRQVWIRPWLYEVTGSGGAVPVLLLDTDVDQNEAEDRLITGRLYGGDAADRLKQEIVLGIGGELVLRALAFKIRTYHLNEGHAALLPLKLLLDTARENGAPRRYDEAAVRGRCVFTTHTPVATAFDQFGYDVVESSAGRLHRNRDPQATGRRQHFKHDPLGAQPQRLREWCRGAACRNSVEDVSGCTHSLHYQRCSSQHMDQLEACGALGSTHSALAP